MYNMKAIGVIFGILLVIGGIYCLVTPVETFGVLSWLIGLAMLVEGISSALTWNERRRFGFADGWTLVGALVSIALGVVVLGSLAVQVAIDTFLAYLVAAWLVFGGAARIAGAIGLRKIYLAGGMIGENWLLLMLLGILIVVMGIACFVNPILAMEGVGMILGLSIIVTGGSIIAASMSR